MKKTTKKSDFSLEIKAGVALKEMQALLKDIEKSGLYKGDIITLKQKNFMTLEILIK